MKAMLRCFLFFCCFATAGGHVWAQQIPWSLYEQNGAALSPAAILQEEQAVFVLQNRRQWMQLGSPYQSNLLRVQYPLLRIEGDTAAYHYATIGLLFLDDTQGDRLQLKQNSLRLAFAYQWRIAKHRIGLGLEAAWHGRRLTGEQITGYDPQGQALQTEYLSTALISVWALNAGIIWRRPELHSVHDRYFLSIGTYDLNRPNVSHSSLLTSRRPPTWQLAAEARLFPLKQSKGFRHSLSPTFYLSKEAGTWAYQAGAWYRYHFSENSGRLFRNGSLGLGLRYHRAGRTALLLALNSATISLQFAYDYTLPSAMPGIDKLGTTEFSIGLKKTLGRVKKLNQFEDFIINDDLGDDNIEELPEEPEP
ncbi:type IX secretion system PorP/SprF family membrane protein [Thermonema lapsum]|uniref:Type IX secretion system PorP/SprF family membrane protein n=1 Tax=Thermonema lapsum TaxID=28195 RepID=A0A846MU20_9BACT|nr:PorP/SprF family type IX secretion system membrane protein [Thermonema lapsum]NIK74727.1 type IX secretion system PorP/SprF family membrane protein [Thermonema lapsum]